MELRSQSVDELTAALWKGKREPTDPDFANLEHKVFRDRPIIRLANDNAVVVDASFLRDMCLGPLFMSSNTDSSLGQFGAAFELYCHDVLAGMYPDAAGLACRLAPSTLGRAASGAAVQIADVMLDCGDKTVLIETKASLMRDDKIDSLEPIDYIEFLRSRYGVTLEGDGRKKKKGVAQLADLVLKIASGEWQQVNAVCPIREHGRPHPTGTRCTDRRTASSLVSRL